MFPARRRLRAFTLIELLTVIAVIGILVAILIPTVGAVQNNARRASTRSFFAQVASACEAFRAEYGYYPDFRFQFDKPSDAANNDKRHNFIRALTGRNPDGSLMNDTEAAGSGNTKRIAFLQFSADQLKRGNVASDTFTESATGPNFYLLDAFGNYEIAIAMDGDGDGASLLPTRGANPDAVLTSGDPNGVRRNGSGTLFSPFTGQGQQRIRQGVVLYSAGVGRTADDIILSFER